MRRSHAATLVLLLSCVVLGSWNQPAQAQKRRRVELPNGTILSPQSRPVLTLDGSIGFVAPAVGDTVVAFAVRTGEVLGTLAGLGNATALTLHETDAHRILVATFAGAPAEGQPAVIVVIEASDPSALAARAIFRLPESLTLSPGTRAIVARGEKFGVVAVSAPVAALISFDLETGEQVGALTLDGVPDSLSVVDRTEDSKIAVVCAGADKVSVVSLADSGVLLPLSVFAPPDDAPLASTNNVRFDGRGDVGYVASLHGGALLSFAVDSGELLDRVPTNGSPAGLTVYHEADREVVAVANISRPGGVADDDVLPKSDEAPLGLPGAVVVSADSTGKLSEISHFYPDTGEEVVPTNNS